MRALLAALVVAGQPALAQEATLQRELILRDQQSDAFRLELRQSQERLSAPPGDTRRRQDIEARQLGERQRLEAASRRQLMELSPDTPPELRPQERARMRAERQSLSEPMRFPPAAGSTPPKALPMTQEPPVPPTPP
jgi:hypothetical protein